MKQIEVVRLEKLGGQQLLPSVDFAWSSVGNSAAPPKLESRENRALVIVVGGVGTLLGQTERAVKEGDVVTIPARSPYAFVTEATLQFLTLTFSDDNAGAKRGAITSLAALLARNEERAAEFVKNPFFDLLRDDTLANHRSLETFRPTIRTFSDAFQTLLFTRAATCTDDRFAPTFASHFHEEMGHNQLIGAAKPLRDPLLEALLSWFTYQMLILDNVEKAVLVHLVLETAGHHFESLGSANRFLRADTAAKYFKAHEADDQHKDMGTSLLSDCHPSTYERLAKILDEGWDMLGQITRRMASIIKC